MKAYTVEYRLIGSEVEKVVILAKDKYDAWVKATFEEIPAKTGEHPYSSWVSAVTHNNGRYQTFNTFEGKPY